MTAALLGERNIKMVGGSNGILGASLTGQGSAPATEKPPPSQGCSFPVHLPHSAPGPPGPVTCGFETV